MLSQPGYIQFVDLRDNTNEHDRWSIKPGLVSLLSVWAINLVCQLPGSFGFFMIPLALVAYAISLIAVSATSLYLVIKKRLRRGASVFFVLLFPVLMWAPINWVADMAHLGLTVGFGAGQRGVVSDPSDGALTIYDWSVGFAGGPNTFLIHDPTDKIGSRVDESTDPDSSEDSFSKECSGNVRHVVKHYYICTF